MPYKDLDVRREYLRQYKADPERRKKYRAAEWKSVRTRLVAAYGGICECCGEDEFEFLALDHKFGGGAEERKRLGPNAAQRLALRHIDRKKISYSLS